jgi:hypothetical protein
MPVRIVVVALLCCVPVMLAMLAAPRFLEGVRIEPFEAVKGAAIGDDPLPPEKYRLAATAFAETLPEDGEERGWYAEFLARSAGIDPKSIAKTRAAALAALSRAPVDTNAWTVLCEAEAAASAGRGTHCFDTAFPVIRYDWFTAGKRMSLLAYEWPYLDEPLRDGAVAVILPMWRSTQWTDGSTLRWQLLELSRSPNGRQMIQAGLPDRSLVRDFNRWVVQEEIDGH